MLFNSPVYIFLFLPLVIVIYFLLNRLRLIGAGKVWLVTASLFFYGYWEPRYLVLIIVSILVNFAIGTALHRSKMVLISASGASRSRRRMLKLLLGIVFNLVLLGYFKYADFLVFNYNWITGDDAGLMNLVLPLAISFFTFQQIAYLVDCYQEDTQEYDFLNYCLFVTFFRS
jgi:alginate O-acetyltransferase complex protein AlgI